MIEVKCTRCHTTKLLTDYPKNKNRKNGVGPWCKSCTSAWSKEWRGTTEGKARQLARRDTPEKRAVIAAKQRLRRTTEKGRLQHYNTTIRYQYGMDLLELVSLYLCQWWRCCGCKSQLRGILQGRGGDHIDHDHNTKTVRGILCAKCNLAVGQVNDNPDVLIRLSEYLKMPRC